VEEAMVAGYPRRPRSMHPADFMVGVLAVYALSSLAPLAQSAERLHGKEKVYGSIP
jgi:hypothetical protein